MTAQLVEAGHETIVFDNLSAGHRSSVHEGARFIWGDLLDAERVRRVLAERFDGVLHFAALSLVGESVEQPERYYRTNVAGTLNLLKAMWASGVARLVFFSTAAVYGEPAEVPITEEAPTRPDTPGLQPGKRLGVLGPRGDRDRPPGYRATDRGRRGPQMGRGPLGRRGFEPEDTGRARMGAGEAGSRHHDLRRLDLDAVLLLRMRARAAPVSGQILSRLHPGPTLHTLPRSSLPRICPARNRGVSTLLRRTGRRSRALPG